MGAGIYGSFLDFFGELFAEVKFFDQIPDIGAGYTDRTPFVTHMVVLQAGTGSSIIANKGRLSLRNVWRTMDLENRDLLWCENETELKQGSFLIHPEDGRVYRLDNKLLFDREGGFTIWGIEKLTGDTGDQKDHLQVIQGAA